MFNRFQNSWQYINHTLYKPGIEEHFVKDQLEDVIEDIKNFCSKQMKKFIYRADYKELLVLAYMFLGGELERTETK